MQKYIIRHDTQKDSLSNKCFHSFAVYETREKERERKREITRQRSDRQ